MEKSRNKELVLITKRFPFFKTEAFLESEITVLAKFFDRITIFPYEVSGYCRKVPNNVVVDISFSECYKKKKSRAIKTLFSVEFIKAILDHKKLLKGAKDLNMLLKFISNTQAYKKFFKGKMELLQNADLVYTYWFNESTYAFLQLKETINFKASIISRAHRFDIYENLATTRSFWPYRKYCLDQVGALFSISEDGKEYLEANYGNHSNINVARLGVCDRDKIAMRSQNSEISIVSVSRIALMKRVDFIKAAIVQYAFEQPELKVKWTHFGDGQGWEELKNTQGIPKNLTLALKGNVKNEEIYAHYAECPVDLFVNLSSSEGIPVSIMEAISFGIPVVATKVGGTGEIVSNITGKLLGANPSLSEVVEAFHEVLGRNIPASQVKNFFDTYYNAAINYSSFSKELSKFNRTEKELQLS